MLYYRLVCREKKQCYQEETRNKVAASCDNVNSFWANVKRFTGSAGSKSQITPTQWYEYFKKLLNSGNPTIDNDFHDNLLAEINWHNKQCDQCEENEPLSLNAVISLEEVRKSNSKIRNGKAAGVDAIIVEVLKHTNNRYKDYICKIQKN